MNTHTRYKMGMNHIDTVFQNLSRPAFIPFVTAGDPDDQTTLNVLNAYADSGADIIEIGIPFSDPVADGETIQRANIRALRGDITIQRIFNTVQAFRKTHKDIPLVLMGYANPIEQYGIEAFMKDCAAYGVDGIIIVDVPPEEAIRYTTHAESYNIAFIRLVTPTTDVDRLKTILNGATGFIYYVSITGVTGAAKPDPSKIETHINMLRNHTSLPIAVGFGIQTPDDARPFLNFADGIVVGSSFVRDIENHANTPETLGIVIKDKTKAFYKVVSQ